jgi:hypothetical protein
MLFGHQKLGPQFLITWNKNGFKDIGRIRKKSWKREEKWPLGLLQRKEGNKFFPNIQIFKHQMYSESFSGHYWIILYKNNPYCIFHSI